jgi:hypothetical protein
VNPTLTQRKAEAKVDRAIATGRIAASAAEPWRRMARAGADPGPALAVLREDPALAVANAHAAAAESPSPELLVGLGFPVAPADSVVGAGPEFA